MYRKQSNLTQTDIASVLGLPNNSRISRWEQGQRHPPLKVLIGYTLLFGVPIETLFQRQKEELLSAMKIRTSQHLKELQSTTQDNKTKRRVIFLQALIKKLDNPVK